MFESTNSYNLVFLIFDDSDNGFVQLKLQSLWRGGEHSWEVLPYSMELNSQLFFFFFSSGSQVM